jgi:hypothetical protein
MKNIMKIKSIQAVLIFIVMSFQGYVYSQSERDIKLSGAYYYGEGIRDSLHLAKVDAREDLLFKISANIISEASSTTEEDAAEVSSNYRQTTKLYSSLKLKGIKFYDKIMPDGRVKVLAYISLEDYRKSIDDIIVSIGEEVRLAERIENEYGMNSAVGLYYEAFLKSYYCPEAIPFKSSIYNEEYSNVRPLLESKIRNFLTKIDLTALDPQFDELYPDQIKIPVNANFGEERVDNVEIRFDLPGNPVRLIEKGKVSMFLYSHPTKTSDVFETIMSIEFDDDPELEEIHKDFGIIERQTIAVNFSNIMKLDFKVVQKEGGFLEFVPDLGVVSIAKIEWHFGDGMQSDELDPIHKYKNPGEYNVVLLLNNDEQLTVHKTISSDGRILGETDNLNAEVQEIEVPAELGNATVAYLFNEIKQVDGDLEIIEPLKSLKLSGNLMYGKKSQFIKPDNCYILVVSTDGTKVLGFLTPADPERLDLLTNSKIESLSKHYKNKRAIWLEIY